jgi:hypothetical protein
MDANPATTASPSTSGVARSGTPGGLGIGNLPRFKKERDREKEYNGPYADLLPLQPGRKVISLLPPELAEGQDHSWIQTTVLRHIDDDKLKYEVRDVDDPDL